MSLKEQYNNTLILLIELNQDKTWLETFYSLREGSNLPSGGAGSLNDWSPYYVGIKRQAWYGTLYKMIRFIYNSNEITKRLEEFKYNAHQLKLYLSTYSNCNKHHIHPSTIEKRLAIEFFKNEVSKQIEQNCLVDILKPELSYNSINVNRIRDKVNMELLKMEISQFNFRNSEFACPYCEEENIQINSVRFLHIDMNVVEVNKALIIKE